MGSFLSKPITEKQSFDGSGEGTLLFSWSEMQGWRVKMEDAHLALRLPAAISRSSLASTSASVVSETSTSSLASAASALPFSAHTIDATASATTTMTTTTSSSLSAGGEGVEKELLHNYLFAVFDGHGGAEVARFCAAHFVQELVGMEEYLNGEFEKALREGFHRMDQLISDEKYAAELCALRVESQLGKKEENGQKGATLSSKGNSSPPKSSILNNAPANATGEELLESAKLIIQEEVEKRLGLAKEKGALSPDEAKDVMQLMLDLKRLSVEPRPKAQIQQPPLITNAGCTAIVALLVMGQKKLFVANAGDSRGVICRAGGKAVALSTDHKPSLPSEIARVQAAGGVIENGRVNASLNLTRSIGDLQHKNKPNLSRENQVITAEPDVISVNLIPGDEFFVLACDGIWDVKSNQEVIDFIRDRLNDKISISSIIEELLDNCLSDSPEKTKGKGTDNMTCVVVKL